MPAKQQRKYPAHPPRVNIRAVREAYGLSRADLMQRIAEQGCEVSEHTIRGVENSNQFVGNKVITAWARALKLNPADIILPPSGSNGNGA